MNAAPPLGKASGPWPKGGGAGKAKQLKPSAPVPVTVSYAPKGKEESPKQEETGPASTSRAAAPGGSLPGSAPSSVPTPTVPPSPPARFMDLPISDPLKRAAHRIGMVFTTAIQAHAIPLLLSGTNAVLEAPPGSGRGLVALPLLSRVKTSNNGFGAVQGLILAPTVRLAMQHAQLLRQLAAAADLKVRVGVLVGNDNDPEETGRLFSDSRRRPHVLVATPGRVAALLRDQTLTIRELKVSKSGGWSRLGQDRKPEELTRATEVPECSRHLVERRLYVLS